MRLHKALFKVSLSNGETILEGKKDYIEIDGQPSPWQRLLLHLSETGAHITSMSIYADGRRYVLPPIGGGGPRFKAFSTADVPVDFSFFRKMGQDVVSGKVGREEIFAVAQAQFSDGTFLEIWVSNDNPDHVWTLRTKNSSAF